MILDSSKLAGGCYEAILERFNKSLSLRHLFCKVRAEVRSCQLLSELDMVGIRAILFHADLKQENSISRHLFLSVLLPGIFLTDV